MGITTLAPPVVPDGRVPRRRKRIALAIGVAVAVLASSLTVYAIEESRIRDRDRTSAAALAQAESDATVERAAAMAKAAHLQQRVRQLERSTTAATTASQRRIAFLESQLLHAAPTTLADGRYFAYVSAATDTPPRILVDRAEFLTGKDAERAAAARGDVVTNAYYVVNDDPALATLVISPDATVRIAGPTTAPTRFVGLARWLHAVQTGTDLSQMSSIHNGCWLTVLNGSVLAIDEQWVP